MVMTMLSTPEEVGGGETETENGMEYISETGGKLNFQEVAAQLSMNKFTTRQSSSEVHRHWRAGVVLESKSIILIDARPSHAALSLPKTLAALLCALSICDLFGSVCAVHSVRSLSPLPFTTSIFSFVLPEFFFCFFLSVFAVEINDVNGRKI